MKTTVISGSHSNTGKTTLGRAIREALDRAVLVKIGTGIEKNGGDIRLYPAGTSFSVIEHEHSDCDYLIIESNSIINEIKPDLHIFLNGTGEEKESAALARANADLRSGERIACREAKKLAGKLGLTPKKFCIILDAASVRLCDCEFGVF